MKKHSFRLATIVRTIVPFSVCTMILVLSCSAILYGCKTNPPEIVPEPTETPTEAPTPEPSAEPTETPVPPEKPYYIELIVSKTDTEHQVNPYSFLRTFYSIVFYDFNLTGIIPMEDRIFIMQRIFSGLSDGAQVNFVIKKYLNVDKLIFVFHFSRDKGVTYLHLKTNYDERAGVLVPLEMPKEEWKRCFAFYTHVINAKIILPQNLYSAARETDLAAKEMFPELLHMYVFDEKDENDVKIDEYTINIMSLEPPAELKIRLLFEHVYFYLLHLQIDDAGKTIKRIETYSLAREKAEFKHLLLIIKEEIEILKTFIEGRTTGEYRFP